MTPEDRAYIALKLRDLLNGLKSDVVNLVLTNAFPEAKAAAERVREEEKFIETTLARLEDEHGLSREDLIAYITKRYRETTPEGRPTAWARLLDPDRLV